MSLVITVGPTRTLDRPIATVEETEKLRGLEQAAA